LRLLASLGRLRRFWHDTAGSATVEFVLVFPAFMVMFVSSFESGLLMTRHVALERALDMAVRTVRINTSIEYDHDDIKELICARARMIPDCENQLKLEMLVRDPRNWVALTGGADCVDRAQPGAASRSFTNGGAHELMILRACVLLDPVFPTSALAFALPNQSGEAYALVSTSAFVMEPDT